jgi:Beta propeller domain
MAIPYLSAMEEGSTYEDASPSGQSSTSNGAHRRKVLWWTVLCALLVAVLGLALGLSLNRNESSVTLSSETDKATVTTSTGSTWTVTITVNPPPSNSSTVTTANTITNGTNATTPSVPQPSPPTTATTPTTKTGTSSMARLAAISPESVSQTYASCDALQADLKISTLMSAQRQIESYSWYFENPPLTMPIVEDGGVGLAAPTPSMVQGDRTSSAVSEGESSFGTNNQVNGVEEPDIVQSNGVQVFAVYGSEILEIDVATVTLTRRTKVPTVTDCSESISAMFLIATRLVVLTNVYSYCYGGPGRPIPLAMEDVGGGGAAPAGTADEAMPIVSSSQKTRVLVYDTTNMQIVSDESLRGYYIGARAIDSNVHVVTSTYFDTWRLFQFLDPYMLETVAGKRLSATTYKQLAEAELDRRIDGYVAQLASELDCTGTQRLALLQDTNDDLSFTSGLDSMVTISSFAIINPSGLSVKNMLIPSGGLQIYSSSERLVLALNGWTVGQGATQATYLVTYKYAGASTAGNTLGSVPGTVLNQFSMDHMEQNGVDYLRVATTTQSVWFMNDKGTWTSSNNATSQVSVLEFNDGEQGRMPLRGQVTGLGKPGEQIYSVRFIGDKGFVVTFLQTDPFYTLDLSDPTNPRMAGELEIPGFSSYLHPASDDMIIGVGQAANTNGTLTGLQISLFDVSDLANPKRVQQYEVSPRRSSGTVSSSSSDAQYDYKAFRYLPENKLLIIPVTVYESSIIPCPVYGDPIPIMPLEGETTATNSTPSGEEMILPFPGPCYGTTGGFDGFRVYRIDAAMGISQHFSIEHASGNAFAYGCWSSAWLSPRSLVFSGDMMTLKGHSILSYDLFTLLPNADLVLDTNVTVCNPWLF